MKPIVLAAALAALSFTALAQPTPGSGPGPGAGPGPRGFHADSGTVPGWSLMTPDERKAQREKMASVKTRAECVTAMEEHQKLMAERAKEKGKTLKWKGAPGRGCNRLPS